MFKKGDRVEYVSADSWATRASGTKGTVIQDQTNELTVNVMYDGSKTVSISSTRYVKKAPDPVTEARALLESKGYTVEPPKWKSVAVEWDLRDGFNRAVVQTNSIQLWNRNGYLGAIYFDTLDKINAVVIKAKNFARENS